MFTPIEVADQIYSDYAKGTVGFTESLERMMEVLDISEEGAADLLVSEDRPSAPR